MRSVDASLARSMRDDLSPTPTPIQTHTPPACWSRSTPGDDPFTTHQPLPLLALQAHTCLPDLLVAHRRPFPELPKTSKATGPPNCDQHAMQQDADSVFTSAHMPYASFPGPLRGKEIGLLESRMNRRRSKKRKKSKGIGQRI